MTSIPLAILLASALGTVAPATPAGTAVDPLPSWNDGPAKMAVNAFVANVAVEGSPGYVPPADRIAVFDNDGTLWAEQPMYSNSVRAGPGRELAPAHPEWRDAEPFRRFSRANQRGLHWRQGSRWRLNATRGDDDRRVAEVVRGGWRCPASGQCRPIRR